MSDNKTKDNESVFTSSWKERNNQVMMPTYGDRNICLNHGDGVYVWDVDGNQYLDFLAGIAVNVLGHCHPAIVGAITTQIGQLQHCTNLYYIPRQIELAELLIDLSELDRAFFCNSGAEANECALKIARLYSNMTYGNGERPAFIAMKNSFHGRTFATLSATGSAKVREGFEPVFPEFRFAEFNNISSVMELLDEKVAGIILEPVQGEGGINPADNEFLVKLRGLCDERDVALIFDEIQCGMGRVGEPFAFQYYKVRPDILTLAKGLGAGFPIGACLAQGKWGEVLGPGKHGSTFGGNPLACAAALAVCRVLFTDGVMENVRSMGQVLWNKLKDLQRKYAIIKEVRGVGLMIGVDLKVPGLTIVKKCEESGLLINCTAQNVLRFVPPLIINETHVDEAVSILDKVFSLEFSV